MLRGTREETHFATDSHDESRVIDRHRIESDPNPLYKDGSGKLEMFSIFTPARHIQSEVIAIVRTARGPDLTSKRFPLDMDVVTPPL
jgi:hypothetical protein